MPYRIAGIDVHKKMLAVVVPTSSSTATFISTARRSGRRRPICAACRLADRARRTAAALEQAAAGSAI